MRLSAKLKLVRSYSAKFRLNLKMLNSSGSNLVAEFKNPDGSWIGAGCAGIWTCPVCPFFFFKLAAARGGPRPRKPEAARRTGPNRSDRARTWRGRRSSSDPDALLSSPAARGSISFLRSFDSRRHRSTGVTLSEELFMTLLRTSEGKYFFTFDEIRE